MFVPLIVACVFNNVAIYIFNTIFELVESRQSEKGYHMYSFTKGFIDLEGVEQGEC